MKNKTLFLLLVISISFFSCNSSVKNPAIPISDIDTDFPVTEQLEFKPFNKYDILEEGYCMIDGSTLWVFAERESDFGSCYDLNTGKELSIIASRGRAANELTELESFHTIGDSILFFTDKKTIKTFAKKDIIDNIPMGERKFSVTTAPDSIWTGQMTKLPNGSVLATIQPALFEFQKRNNNEINQKSIAIFNNREVNFYETIKYDSFDVESAKGTEIATNDLIKHAYSNGFIGVRNNDMAVFSVSDQFIFYTFDIKNGNVINEKRYTKIQRPGAAAEGQVSFVTINDRHLNINSIKLNDKYILCGVDGNLSEEDKKSNKIKNAIFIFDWDLNPIKKYDLPEKKNGYYSISNDVNSVYFYEFNEDGLALYKADLNI